MKYFIYLLSVLCLCLGLNKSQAADTEDFSPCKQYPGAMLIKDPKGCSWDMGGLAGQDKDGFCCCPKGESYVDSTRGCIPDDKIQAEKDELCKKTYPGTIFGRPFDEVGGHAGRIEKVDCYCPKGESFLPSSKKCLPKEEILTLNKKLSEEKKTEEDKICKEKYPGSTSVQGGGIIGAIGRTMCFCPKGQAYRGGTCIPNNCENLYPGSSDVKGDFSRFAGNAGKSKCYCPEGEAYSHSLQSCRPDTCEKEFPGSSTKNSGGDRAGNTKDGITCFCPEGEVFSNGHCHPTECEKEFPGSSDRISGKYVGTTENGTMCYCRSGKKIIADAACYADCGSAYPGTSYKKGGEYVGTYNGTQCYCPEGSTWFASISQCVRSLRKVSKHNNNQYPASSCTHTYPGTSEDGEGGYAGITEGGIHCYCPVGKIYSNGNCDMDCKREGSCTDNSDLCPGFFCAVGYDGKPKDACCNGKYCENKSHLPTKGGKVEVAFSSTFTYKTSAGDWGKRTYARFQGNPKVISEKYVASVDPMNWDSAVNFCQATKKAIDMGIKGTENFPIIQGKVVKNASVPKAKGSQEYWTTQFCQCENYGWLIGPSINDPIENSVNQGDCPDGGSDACGARVVPSMKCKTRVTGNLALCE